jgi:NADH-quinone oxidoreductase subunit E
VTATEEVFGPQLVAEAAEIIGRYPVARSALLPMLHLVQSKEGHVSRDGIAFCADQLDLTTAEVDAVVTFYTMYKRTRCGEHLVGVCTNTMCAMLGGDEIYARLREHLGADDAADISGHSVEHDETFGEPGTTGSITLEHVECLAACDLGPVIQVNYEFYDNQTVDSAVELVYRLRRGERPAPDRGAPALADFRAAERELAGFFDDLDTTVDGPSAATETLRGAAIAADRGWTAPVMPEDVPLPAVPEAK